MKILRILPGMDFGGIERGVFDFALNASELGHEVVIASGGGRFLPPLIQKGIHWHNVPMEKKNIFTFINSARRLKKIIEREKPDILHAQSRFPCMITAYLMRSFPSIPWITSIHNFHTARHSSKFSGKGTLVITVSKALKKHAIEYLRVEEKKIRVVYNGIEESFLNIKKTQNYPLSIGIIARFTRWKGHFDFLKAIKMLSDDGYEIKALIVGSGSRAYKARLQKWIAENSLAGTVTIVKNDAGEALKKIDILIVPSLEPEGFGRTVVEAQMSSTPVIATNLGAVPELVEDGISGFLIEPGKPKLLAEKIKQLLQNPQKAASVIEKARNNAVKNFTTSIMTEKTLNVYLEAIQKHKTSAGIN